MDNKYTVTLHIGRRTKTGFVTRFKLVSELKGDMPYRAAESTMSILDERVLEKNRLTVNSWN